MFKVIWKKRHLEHHGYSLMKYDLGWYIKARWYSPLFWLEAFKEFFTSDMSFSDFKKEIKILLKPEKYDYYILKGITSDNVGKVFFYRLALSVFEDD